VAFFDGTTTGQLTSRLNNDSQSMVQPIQSLLQSLLTNVILLLGGLVMCLYTSWKLSVLAFTAIGPIIYLTRTYAKWSQGIFRDILSAIAEANSSGKATHPAFSAHPRTFLLSLDNHAWHAHSAGVAYLFISAGRICSRAGAEQHPHCACVFHGAAGGGQVLGRHDAGAAEGAQGRIHLRHDLCTHQLSRFSRT